MTDSASDLSLDRARELGIAVVPASVVCDGVSYLDQVELTPDMLYNKMRGGAHISTSQAPMGLFMKVYEEALQHADEVVAIHVSSRLSGTWNTACMAAEAVSASKITVLDSNQVSMGTGLQAVKLAELVAEGWNREQIEQHFSYFRSEAGLVAYIDSLEYITRGGRVPRLTAWVGELLNVKPIIEVRGGEVVPTGRVRGHRRSMQVLLDMLQERVGPDAVRLAVGHTGAPDMAAEMAEQARKRVKCTRVETFEIGSTVAAHVGPGAVGFTWLKDR